MTVKKNVVFSPSFFDDLQDVEATTGSDITLHPDEQIDSVDMMKSDGGERVVPNSEMFMSVKLGSLSLMRLGLFLSRLQSSMRFT